MTGTCAVIGEALVDLVPKGVTGDYRAGPGGSPFNVAIGLTRLGNPTALMARLSDDGFGRMLRAVAEGEGIDLSAAPRAAARRQGRQDPDRRQGAGRQGVLLSRDGARECAG